MCHKRTDRSRTSSRASESEDEREREDERVPWGVRARKRLAAFVPTDEGDQTEESPERPTVEPETVRRDPVEDAADSETEDEREEAPIPADD